MTTKSLAVLSALTIIGGSLFLSSSVLAAEADGESLLQRISEKFNLNKEEVQKVSEDFRREKIKTTGSRRQARLEEKLSNAVKNGKLTQAQKSAILKKMDELQKKHNQERIDLENWAKENGLDKAGYGFGLGIGKFGMGKGMHFVR